MTQRRWRLTVACTAAGVFSVVLAATSGWFPDVPLRHQGEWRSTEVVIDGVSYGAGQRLTITDDSVEGALFCNSFSGTWDELWSTAVGCELNGGAIWEPRLLEEPERWPEEGFGQALANGPRRIGSILVFEAEGVRIVYERAWNGEPE